MAEYSYDSVIIDPNKEGVESLIGKEVYFSDIPNICLENANKNDISYFGTLERIRKDGNNPFMVKSILSTTYWSCIIPKKEEPKPKYVHFENAEEFLDAYYRNETKKLDGIYRYLATRGIWIKGKGTYNSYYMITELWDDGVIIGDSKINTTKVSSDRYFTANDITDWHELYDKYTFLDGSPCGKEVKDEADK